MGAGWPRGIFAVMQFDREEIEHLARALAPQIADILEARLSELPQWAFSIAEAAAWARLPEHVVRAAVANGRLRVVHVGRQLRIRRSELFGLKADQPDEPANGDTQ